MSNLLTDQEGRDVVVTAQRYLIQRRLSRFFKRNFVIAFDDYENTGYFDLSILLGQLNEAHDPELRALFRLLALTGALPTTFETLEVYVDGTTGNDISGDGSATHPFKTLWFVDYLPKTILHPVRIVIADNCNAGGQLSLNFDFAKDGCLTFIGRGPAVEQVSAATLAGVSNGTVNDITANIAHWFEADTQVWTVDQYWGRFMQLLSGASAGYASPITKNTATMIFTHDAPFNGQTGLIDCRIIVPPVSIACQKLSLDSRCSDPEISEYFTDQPARIGFVNLDIYSSEGGAAIAGSAQSYWSFARLFYENIASTPGMYISDHVFGRNRLADDIATIQTLSDSDVTNINSVSGPIFDAGFVLGRVGSYPATFSEEIDVKNSTVYRLTNFGGMYERSSSVFYDCASGTVRVQDRARLNLQCVRGSTLSGRGGGVEIIDGHALINQFLVLGPSSACIAVPSGVGIFTVFQGGRSAGWTEDGQYGLISDALVFGRLEQNPVNLTGVVGDWRQLSITPAQTVAWPLSQASVTDGIGSLVNRL